VSSPSPVSPSTCSVWRSRTIGDGNAPHPPPPNRTVAEYIALRPRRGSASPPVPANLASSQSRFQPISFQPMSTTVTPDTTDNLRGSRLRRDDTRPVPSDRVTDHGRLWLAAVVASQ
jgi:hypothetical protein